jgi:transcriptional coactivator HFI1/ADA1
MLPFCYQAGLVNGHSSDAAQLITVATETFIKELLSSVFTRTRSNGPGESGSAGFGSGAGWIQTRRYRRQLRREEAQLMRGELSRDKSGLLPIEAKAANERRPLSITDMRIALDIGDCGLGSFPISTKSIVYNYREGELEHWDDYSWIDGYEFDQPEDIEMSGTTTIATTTAITDKALPNGVVHAEPMEIDSEIGWEGTSAEDMAQLDSILDSCLAAAA